VACSSVWLTETESSDKETVGEIASDAGVTVVTANEIVSRKSVVQGPASRDVTALIMKNKTVTFSANIVKAKD